MDGTAGRSAGIFFSLHPPHLAPECNIVSPLILPHSELGTGTMPLVCQQCATYAIWGTFAMAGFEEVPGSQCKPLLKDFCTKEVKIAPLLVLCAGPVAKKVDGCHIRVFLSNFFQEGFQVLPYCRWSLQPGG